MSEEKITAPKEKMTFLKWIDNFWYHNKTAVVIGTFALIIFLIGTVQFFSKRDPDVFIFYVGHGNISAKSTEILKGELASQYAEDYNDDGEIVIDYKSEVFTMVQNENGEREKFNPTAQMTSTQSFNLELGMGECVVYIMEPSFFRTNTDYIANLEDVLGYVPKNAVSGKGIKVSDLKAYRNTELKKYPEDFIICLAAKKSRFDDDYYDGHVKFFRNLVGNEANDKLIPYEASVFYVGHAETDFGRNDTANNDLFTLIDVDDYNGDNKVKVDYKSCIFKMLEDENGARYVDGSVDQTEAINSFNHELGTGDCVIYIMEPAFFEANTDYFESLMNVLGYVPENSLSGKGIRLSNLKAYISTDLSEISGDYVMCVARNDSRFDRRYYESNVECFKNIVEFDID